MIFMSSFLLDWKGKDIKPADGTAFSEEYRSMQLIGDKLYSAIGGCQPENIL